MLLNHESENYMLLWEADNCVNNPDSLTNLTLCMLGIFHNFLLSVDFFQN